MEGMMGHHMGTQAAAATMDSQVSANIVRPALVETQENPSVLRLTAALLVGSVSFVCATFLVVCVRKSVRGLHGTSKFDRIHSCTMCFASGVFLATVFLALFPDLQRRVELLQRTLSVSHGQPYPLSELLLLAALFANWMLDRFLAAAFLASRDWLRTLRRLRVRHRMRRGRTRITQAQAQPFLSECDSSEELARDTDLDGVADSECELHSKQLLPENEEYVTQAFEQDGAKQPLETSNYRLVLAAQHRASEAEQERSQARARVVRFMLLFTAMCAHATLEGGALSTLSDGASVAMLSVAMLAHSFVCACAVALAALGTFASRTPHRAIACALCSAAAFCFLPFIVVAFVQLVTPAMHTAINNTHLHNQTTLTNGSNTQTNKETPSVAAIGFESFAIGSFLYVVFICWLPAELNGKGGAHAPPRSCHADTIQTEADSATVSMTRHDESTLDCGTQLRSTDVDDHESNTNKTITEADQAQTHGASNGKTQRSDRNKSRVSGAHDKLELQSVPVDDAAFRSVKDELLKLTLCFTGALLVALLRLIGPHH